MTDVIDSLKRLERVGAENSKTTEKLIAAARQISELVVKYAGVSDAETIQVSSNVAEDGVDEETGATKIRIRRNKPGEYYIRGGALCDEGGSVYRNRKAALNLSEAVARGLLDVICETLERCSLEHERAVGVLAAAVEQMKNK